MLERKERKFIWTSAQHKSFNLIKDALTTIPVMARPDFDKTFKLYTDASKYRLGFILAQDHDDGEYVIAYAERTTRGAEPNYGATQLECITAIWVVQYFRHYLIGKRFTLIT